MLERTCGTRLSECAIDAVASANGGKAFYLFGGLPFLTFQRWAAKAEPVAPSPLGILMYPEYDLRHAYRNAVTYTVEIDFPPKDDRPAPCDSCAEKPCLSACPVGAFTDTVYEIPQCMEYLTDHPKEDCMDWGCRARCHWPVGTPHAYVSGQAAFHMQAFLKARCMEVSHDP